MDNFVADAIFIDAPPERVLAALLDPEEILTWMDAEYARVGGAEGGEFTVRRADGSTLSGTIAAVEPEKRLAISDYYRELGDERRGPMALEFRLEERDGGVWLTVRQNDLDSRKGWEAFAEETRREWVRATVALKRHIEQI